MSACAGRCTVRMAREGYGGTNPTREAHLTPWFDLQHAHYRPAGNGDAELGGRFSNEETLAATAFVFH